MTEIMEDELGKLAPSSPENILRIKMRAIKLLQLIEEWENEDDEEEWI